MPILLLKYFISHRDCSSSYFSKSSFAPLVSPNAFYARGITKLAMANPEGAVDDCTEAIKKGYKGSEVYKARGEAKESMGDTEGAKEDFEKYE